LEGRRDLCVRRQVGHRRLWARVRCTYLMAPTLSAHGITIPNRLGKCLPHPAAAAGWNITARSFGSPNRYGRQQLQADRGQAREARWLHAGPADDPIHQGGSEARGADRGDHRAGAREAPVVRMVGVAKAWPVRCENETSAEQPGSVQCDGAKGRAQERLRGPRVSDHISTMLGGVPLRRPCARSASQVGLPELGLCESGGSPCCRSRRQGDTMRREFTMSGVTCVLLLLPHF